MQQSDNIYPRSCWYITGGGSQFISNILSNGGASKFVEEVVVPYGTASSSTLLGYSPKRYACADVARHLAVKAYYRCRELIKNTDEPALGLGVTCKLSVEGERADRRHEVHIAVHQCESTSVSSFQLTDNDRKKEERLAAELIKNELIGGGYPAGAYRFDHAFQPTRSQDIIDLVRGSKNSIVMDAIRNPFYLHKPVIFPGSFNPPHHKHEEMARLAWESTGSQVYFELCIHNTDKPSLDHIDIHYRYYNLLKYCEQPWYGGIIFTATPLFVDKKDLFIEPQFIVGTDTLRRIMSSKYYNSLYNFRLSMNELESDCRFLHFQRKNEHITAIPSECKNLNIKQMEYEDNGLSSTQIRNGATSTQV
jgi:nicotinic acid mononucleotide adenylyltransferase